MADKIEKLYTLVREAHCAAHYDGAEWRRQFDALLKRDGIEATEEEIKCAVHRRYFENPYAFEYIVLTSKYFQNGWQFTPSKED